MHAAIEAGVPIIAIAVQGKGYDFTRAADLMLHLDTKLDVVNPGACAMLRKEGVDPLDVAFKLSTVLPSIISVKFDSSGSANSINASLLDIIEAMKAATPIVIKHSRDQWLQSRLQSRSSTAGSLEKQHGGTSSPLTPASASAIVETTALASIPLSVPELPVRPTVSVSHDES
jgi:hypothetical protein